MDVDWLDRLAGYRLVPALPISEVERFEERNRIELPAEYRSFITTICSGIYAEEDQPGRLMELLRPPNLALDESLNRPFPWVEHRLFEDDELYERSRNGRLYLATDGCSCDWYLIITGAERGGMWEIEADGAQPCCPKLTFLPWLKLRIDCDSGRNSMEWWDAVWHEFDPSTVVSIADRWASDENALRDAIQVELEREFPSDGYRRTEDAQTVAIFSAAHPEVGDAAICVDGDEAIVFVGEITRERFRLPKDRYSGAEAATFVAREVMRFLADLFSDKIILWQCTGGLTSGRHWKVNTWSEIEVEPAGRYYRWSGPLRNRELIDE